MRDGLGRRNRARHRRSPASERGEKVGVLQVRLYRPFAADGVPRGAAADRALRSRCWSRPRNPARQASRCISTWCNPRAGGGERPAGGMPLIIGGRYGLSSKDFNPPLAKAVFDELRQAGAAQRLHRRHRSTTSRTPAWPPMPAFRIEPPDLVQAVFYGLGADGTVGANKNSVKIIAEDAGLYAQGYFVYDSHKSGAQTISHLRFGPTPIHAPYLIQQASFVGCHQFQFVERHDVLRLAAPGATVLLNAPVRPRRGVGPSAARDAAADHRDWGCGCSSSTRRKRGRGRRPARPHQHRCCRPASSPSPACCRATRRSTHIKHSISKTYSGKGDERRGRRTSAPSTTRWPGCSR